MEDVERNPQDYQVIHKRDKTVYSWQYVCTDKKSGDKTSWYNCVKLIENYYYSDRMEICRN